MARPYLGTVLRFSLGNCTNGISAKATSIYVFPENVDIDEAIDYCEKHDMNLRDTFIVETIWKNSPNEYKRAIPLDNRGIVVAGGNYVKLDQRCTGVPYPIAIHDRRETQEEYDALSR